MKLRIDPKELAQIMLSGAKVTYYLKGNSTQQSIVFGQDKEAEEFFKLARDHMPDLLLKVDPGE
jgi:hypothetical protein